MYIYYEAISRAHRKINRLNSILDSGSIDISANIDEIGFNNKTILDIDEEFKKEIIVRSIEQNERWINEWELALNEAIVNNAIIEYSKETKKED